MIDGKKEYFYMIIEICYRSLEKLVIGVGWGGGVWGVFSKCNDLNVGKNNEIVLERRLGFFKVE